MKKLFFTGLLIAGNWASAQSTVADASRCAHEGRCTGSAYCTACSNCSRCAHCGSGGTCGVCSSAQTYYELPKPKKKHKSRTATSEPRVYYGNEMLYACAPEVNLRKGPGTKYEIVEKLVKGQPVHFISQTGEWIYVKVEDSENKGYIHSKYLK